MNIKQIIPADGWWAVAQRYSDEPPHIYRVICWALVEGEEGQQITPMVEWNEQYIGPMGAMFSRWHYEYGLTYEEIYERVKQVSDALGKLVNRGGNVETDNL